MKRLLGHLAVGAYMGAVLSRIGFASWDQLHAMFVFSSLRMLLAFAGTVVLLFIAWRVLARAGEPIGVSRPFHSGSVPGGVLFGCGWALTGACPAGVFVQLGEGQLLALCTLAGIVLGNWAFAAGQGKIFRFNPGGSCTGEP